MTHQEISRHLTEIYTLLCRSGMNKDYYGQVLHKYQLASSWMDVLIAIGSAGGSLAALTIWNSIYGKYIWGCLTAIATLLAVIKPVLKLNTEIERLTKLFAGHSEIYNNMLVLGSRIKRVNNLTLEMISAFEVSEQKFLDLCRDDDPHPKIKLLRRCEDSIRAKHSPDSFWFPDACKTAEGEAQISTNSGQPT